MNKVLQIVWYWVYRGPSELIMVATECASGTACDWKSFCREVCVEVIMDESVPIGGPGMIVEIDENKFGKRKFNRGKRVDGKWVFGGVERGSKNCFLKVVPDRSKETLLNVLQTYVLPGTTIISDCWSSYNCLQDEGFVHLRVNHSLNFKDPDTGAHTNTIEGTWGAVKRGLTTHKVKNQLDYYLAEYAWRKKNSRGNKFMLFLDAILKIYKPPCKDVLVQE